MTNLDTIIITGITVLGSLLGAVLGYMGSIKTTNKSNQHALELEKMRLEHERTMKEKERNRALLEELCSLVYGFHSDIITAFVSKDNNNESTVLKSQKTWERIGVI